MFRRLVSICALMLLAVACQPNTVSKAPVKKAPVQSRLLLNEINGVYRPCRISFSEKRIFNGGNDNCRKSVIVVKNRIGTGKIYDLFGEYPNPNPSGNVKIYFTEISGLKANYVSTRIIHSLGGTRYAKPVIEKKNGTAKYDPKTGQISFDVGGPFWQMHKIGSDGKTYWERREAASKAASRHAQIQREKNARAIQALSSVVNGVAAARNSRSSSSQPKSRSGCACSAAARAAGHCSGNCSKAVLY